MAKKTAADSAKKRAPAPDAFTRARQIAERAKPNMRATEVLPLSDAEAAKPDAQLSDLESMHKKYGTTNRRFSNGGKELNMVMMEPKKATDDIAGRQRKAVIVDDEQVVGEQG